MGFSKWSRGPIVGRGASATVSLATDSLSGHSFAVKSADLRSSAFLQREQRFLSSVTSPHVVSYIGFDVTSEGSGPVYNLHMEYLPCGSVADEIARCGGKGLEESAIRSYLHGVLMALSYLHSRGIAHCDVKGRNVLIAADGAAKLADFGCARWVGGGEEESPSIGGTPVFMAPEVARGEEQGTAADVWAAGCTVIEMATGRPPWPDATDPVSAMHRIAFSGDVPEVPKGISDEGRDFLGKCLSRDPKQRWSADELLQHPFVANPINGGEPTCSPNTYWRSPKCVLDQDIWNSLDDDESDYEAEAEGQSPVMGPGPSERIRQLSDGRDGGDDASTASSWSWDDEDWITIRSGSSDCSSSSSSGGGAAAFTGDKNWELVEEQQAERAGTLFFINHSVNDHLFLIRDSPVPDHNIVNLGDFPLHQQSNCCSCYSLLFLTISKHIRPMRVTNSISTNDASNPSYSSLFNSCYSS